MPAAVAVHSGIFPVKPHPRPDRSQRRYPPFVIAVGNHQLVSGRTIHRNPRCEPINYSVALAGQIRVAPSKEAGMSEFILFLIVGFLAQAVDGALGMAYGAISSTVLLSFGVPPAQASASVHAAELFTTAASGSAHLVHRNVDWQLFWRLAPAGIVGGCIGAYVLTSFEGDAVKPFVTTYLAVIGLFLVVRSFHKIPSNPVPARVVAPLGASEVFWTLPAAEAGVRW